MNIYTGIYVKASSDTLEGYAATPVGIDGKLIGPVADSSWLNVVPNSIRKYMEYVHDRYKVPIYITENGVDCPNETGATKEYLLNDTFRVNYYRDYLDQAAAAVLESGVDLRGYYAWSLLDNFEWADGYRYRFGLTYVNYTTQERTTKNSGKWFKKLLEKLKPPKHLRMPVHRQEDILV